MPEASYEISAGYRIHKYLPFALLYFFFNIIGLPFGLTWTALLGPFFYGWVLLKEKRDILLPFIFSLSPFLVVQVTGGVDQGSYILSLVNLLMIYFFAMAVRTWLKISPGSLNRILTVILVVNFVICLIAVVLYFTPWREWMWIEQDITSGVRDFSRLKMFTYEASHYATLFVPVFVFFLIRFFRQQNRIPGPALILMISLPLLLSFSFGVLASLFLAVSAVFFLDFKTLAPNKRVLNTAISLVAILSSLLVVSIIFYPDNVFFERLINIFSGQDTSAEGRTVDAFHLAVKILEENGTPWFGIGPGQLKYVGVDIIREYYLYYETTAVAIPNVVAETLVLFGWVGLALRMFILLFLFCVTGVWRDHFRLVLFLFMFIYQFTGSYITNPAEWVIWVLAFTVRIPTEAQRRHRAHGEISQN